MLTRETYVSLDGDVIHYDKPSPESINDGFSHTFLIDEVAYTLRTEPGRHNWCEVYRTDDGPTAPPQLTLSHWILLILGCLMCLFLMSTFISFTNPGIIVWIDDELRKLKIDEVILLIGLVLTSIGIVYVTRGSLKGPHRVTAAIGNEATPAGGSLPRRGSFFRPWLEDIHRIAMRCRRVKR